MYKLLIVLGAATGLAACGSNNHAENNVAANTAAVEQPKPAYCFFKDSETKDWKAKAAKDGNVVVSGKAYREDARYKAALSPAIVTGTTAVVSPTVEQNTGYAAPGDWWDVSQTIPDSQAVETVTVTCGGKALATLSVPRKK